MSVKKLKSINFHTFFCHLRSSLSTKTISLFGTHFEIVDEVTWNMMSIKHSFSRQICWYKKGHYQLCVCSPPGGCFCAEENKTSAMLMYIWFFFLFRLDDQVWRRFHNHYILDKWATESCFFPFILINILSLLISRFKPPFENMLIK